MQLIAVLLLGLILSMLAICSYVIPRLSPQSVAANRIVAKDLSPIVVVNETSRIERTPVCLGSGGIWGDESRIVAEEYFRAKKYRMAIKYFMRALDVNANDERASLGLGQSYLALGEAENALAPLCMVRDDCFNHRQNAENSDEGDPHIMPEMTDFEMMPGHGRDAVDHEARTALEQAVLAIQPPTTVNAEMRAYKSEKHFKVLSSALKLVDKYRKSHEYHVVISLLRLADENTRTLPSHFVDDLICSGDTEKQWGELAQRALNALRDEERYWYMDRLSSLSNHLPDNDIRKAAAFHYVATMDLDDSDTWPQLNEAYALMQKHHQSSPYAASCAYDRAVVEVQNGYLDEGHQLFSQALQGYRKSNDAESVAASEYNLGLISYQLDDLYHAKEYFRSACRHFTDQNDQRTSAYNAAVACTEYNTSAKDKEFMSGLTKINDSLESLTQSAVYKVKTGDLEGAVQPLLEAMEGYYPCGEQNGGFSSTAVEGAPYHIVKFTDEQVLQTLFKRSSRIAKRLPTRFGGAKLPSGGTFLEARHGLLDEHTFESSPYYADLAHILFTHVMQNTGRNAEMSEFFKRRLKRHPNKIPSPKEPSYQQQLMHTFQSCWFCPPHEMNQQMIVTIRVTADGKINDMFVDQFADQAAVNQSILDETMKWAQPLPKPPVNLVGKDIRIVFNASTPVFPSAPKLQAFPVTYFGDGKTAW